MYALLKIFQNLLDVGFEMEPRDSTPLWYWLTNLSLLAAVVYARFDSAVISVAVLVGIFTNLGQRSATSVSAYSIFNRGFQRLLGDVQPDAIDRQLRGGGSAVPNVSEQDTVSEKDHKFTNFPSKFINRPCPCGSGLKAKKCCAASRKQGKTQQTGRVKHDDTNYDFSQFEVLQ